MSKRNQAAASSIRAHRHVRLLCIAGVALGLTLSVWSWGLRLQAPRPNLKSSNREMAAFPPAACQHSIYLADICTGCAEVSMLVWPCRHPIWCGKRPGQG